MARVFRAMTIRERLAVAFMIAFPLLVVARHLTIDQPNEFDYFFLAVTAVVALILDAVIVALIAWNVSRRIRAGRR